MKAKKWYVKYPLDAFALGPYEFGEPVDEAHVVEVATKQFGEAPAEVWPDGPVTEES